MNVHCIHLNVRLRINDNLMTYLFIFAFACNSKTVNEFSIMTFLQIFHLESISSGLKKVLFLSLYFFKVSNIFIF